MYFHNERENAGPWQPVRTYLMINVTVKWTRILNRKTNQISNSYSKKIFEWFSIQYLKCHLHLFFFLVYFLHNLIMWYIFKIFSKNGRELAFIHRKWIGSWKMSVTYNSWVQLVGEEGLKSQRKIVAYVKEDKDYEDKHLFYLEYCPLINCLQ